jgi:hypothetical protein
MEQFPGSEVVVHRERGEGAPNSGGIHQTRLALNIRGDSSHRPRAKVARKVE